ncbi:hypothetical protein K493DRAFT_374524 [Basidiobolus meristosporus CBS 931.73]|uniref:P-type ATPase A domain-containing protein n=1 Tax=Basidiobolus meristosporus CBS 931.73 TaxID=1314790 RepID=A0A1Y1Y7C6_9FUNG|nr:hypothetical protein K493DRAFT_374524 [Basidiobolus meristosporus CBS 931.73]|eukprot:ORX93922.1 hypothetical protein K493DRAFT_374524 [Basidiobolus meristosporus CBS 931.73]
MRSLLSRIVVVTSILLCLSLVVAVPFTPINSHNAEGQACPLKTKYDAQCPKLCVADISQCPSDITPTCPTGQSYCGDGKCHDSCDRVVSVCSCDGSSSSMVPCLDTKTVNVPKYNPKEGDKQVAETCTRELGLLDVPMWSAGFKGNMVWMSCPKTAVKGHFTYKEPMWIVAWVIIATEAGILGLWTLYKNIRERGVGHISQAESFRSTKELSEKADKEKEKVTEVEDSSDADDFTLTGYSNDILGFLGFYSVIFMALAWLVWLAVITADYYGTVTGLAYGLFYGDSDLSMYVFMIVWYLAAFWARMRNFFRLKSQATKCQFIQIEKPLATTILLNDNSKMLNMVTLVENKIKSLFKWNFHVTTSPVKATTLGRRYFEFQCTRYVYDDQLAVYKPFNVEVGEKNYELVSQSEGLTNETVLHRRELIGENFIQVYVPSFPVALLQEFASLFYLYQIMILWLFYYFNYYYIGLVDTGVILISALIRVFTRLNSEHRVKKMAEHQSECVILREGEWITLSTSDLVPGDVFEVKKGITVPCDAVVLGGNIVADESSLTGEPLPIRKFPIKDDDQDYDPQGAGKISTLYAGTTISQASRTGDMKGDRVSALVTRTGTSTDKGQLVRRILFPNPISFIFDQQLKIVMLILLLWGLVCFACSIWLGRNGGIASWFYGMFAISQIISPLLPAALVVGQSVAAKRLRDKKIFCVDLPRIIIAGKVQMFCFDKTGTLTKEGLEFYGVQPVDGYEDRIGQDLSQTKLKFGPHTEAFSDITSLFKVGLATCHSVTQVEDQLIGNPVDIEMFRSTKWQLQDQPEKGFVDSIKSTDDPTGHLVHVVKRFEFIHARASMSVAVLDPVTQHVHIFVKGSFEKVKELSNPASIPLEYDDMANKLAMEGCYVLAMAHCDLGKIDPETVRTLSREQLESNIDFMGLVLFKNMLKPDTKEAIAELKEGDTRTIMITGDTALTGIYIARACEMLPPNNRVLLGDINRDGEVVWSDVDTGAVADVEQALSEKATHPVELAVTAKAFNALCDSNQIRRLLLDIRVFAQCVQLHMERGVTAMCGDGGNDCGALRASHVGIALSDAEASIVSPFSSSFRSIMSCVELLKQGRAALATSFAGYKYLIMYGQTMSWMKIFTFYFSMTPSQYVWILIDAFITVGLSWTISQSKPAKRLADSRPTARILGPETMASVLGLVVINHLFVIGAYCFLRKQPFYLCNEFDSSTVDYAKWWLLGDNYEAELSALVALFQFVNSAFIFNIGYKFRARWYRNYPLIFLWAVFVAIVSYVELADPNRFGCIFRLVALGYKRPDWYIEPYNLPQGHNLWGLSLSNMALGVIWQTFFVLGPRLKVKL